MTATITVSIWHNVTRDSEGRPTGYFGFNPGDSMVRVFTYQAPADGRPAEAVAEEAFEAFNADPELLTGRQLELAIRYRNRALRSLSRGDLVVVGEVALACERAGWAPVRGGITEVRAGEHGTHPLPAGRPARAGQRPAARGKGDQPR